ncbi:putative membrane protein [Marinicella litoralis]|uniref:Putative membrane protein n=2 Tax=Marinicella litoralis TaxID=644220 RepID=A0A4R6XQA3_9GAMM|nr:putative membrane protein [Marinicella litoralis]
MSSRISWVLMTLLALGVAGYAMMNLLLPSFRNPFVQQIFALSPSAISLHLFGGSVAMIVGAFQLNSKLRARYIVMHRWLGRVYVLAVAIGGVAGFILALNSFGGMTTHLGFGLMAVCWLATTLMAYWHIRQGNVRAHRDWMLRSYALTLAGVTLRVYLGISALIGVKFVDFYPILSWICWVPNLLIVQWFIIKYPYKNSNN